MKYSLGAAIIQFNKADDAKLIVAISIYDFYALFLTEILKHHIAYTKKPSPPLALF